MITNKKQLLLRTAFNFNRFLKPFISPLAEVHCCCSNVGIILPLLTYICYLSTMLWQTKTVQKKKLYWHFFNKVVSPENAGWRWAGMCSLYTRHHNHESNQRGRGSDCPVLYLLRICTLLFWSACIINAFIIILHKNFFLNKDVYATMTDILSNYTDNLSNLDTLSWFKWQQHHGSSYQTHWKTGLFRPWEWTISFGLLCCCPLKTKTWTSSYIII